MAFIFDPSKGETPETLRRKRDIAAALREAAIGTPSSPGEGLSMIGAALGARMAENRANKAAAYGQEQATAGFAPIIAALGGGQSGPAPAASPAGAPASSPPAAFSSAVDEGARPTGPGFAQVAAAGKGWTEVVGPDGKRIRREGARNWRNNNPGNIEFGKFAQSAGAIGTDGRFAVFPTYEAGRQAKAKLLFESPNYRDKSIIGAISRYAPAFENDTGGYANAVARSIGVDINTPISALNPQQREIMLDAMERVEGFKVGREIAADGSTMTAMAPQRQTPPAAAAINAIAPQGAGLPPQAAPTMQPAAPSRGTQPMPVNSEFSDNPDMRLQMMRAQAGGGIQQPDPQMAQGGGMPAPQQQAAPTPQMQPMAPQGGQTAAPAQPGSLGLPQLLQMASDPWLSESPIYGGIVKMLVEDQLQMNKPMDPLEKAQLEKLLIETEQLRNPRLSPADEARIGLDREKFAAEQQQASQTDDLREYDRYATQERAAGREPMGVLDFITATKKAGTPSNFGTIPQGYVLREGPDGAQMVPVPGGPADTSAQQQAKADAASTSSDIVTSAAQRAREAAGNRNFGGTGTSLVGMLPWTDSAEVMRQTQVLKSMATIENLNAMRQQSPTGGALGNVTEGEGKMLAAKSGALDPNSPNFERDLADYERTLLRVIHGKEAGDKMFGAPAAAGGSAAEKPISEMTDEELEALINGQ